MKGKIKIKWECQWCQTEHVETRKEDSVHTGQLHKGIQLECSHCGNFTPTDVLVKIG